MFLERVGLGLFWSHCNRILRERPTVPPLSYFGPTREYVRVPLSPVAFLRGDAPTSKFARFSRVYREGLNLRLAIATALVVLGTPNALPAIICPRSEPTGLA